MRGINTASMTPLKRSNFLQGDLIIIPHPSQARHLLSCSRTISNARMSNLAELKAAIPMWPQVTNKDLLGTEDFHRRLRNWAQVETFKKDESVKLAIRFLRVCWQMLCDFAGANGSRGWKKGAPELRLAGKIFEALGPKAVNFNSAFQPLHEYFGHLKDGDFEKGPTTKHISQLEKMFVIIDATKDDDDIPDLAPAEYDIEGMLHELRGFYTSSSKSDSNDRYCAEDRNSKDAIASGTLESNASDADDEFSESEAEGNGVGLQASAESEKYIPSSHKQKCRWRMASNVDDDDRSIYFQKRRNSVSRSFKR